MLVFALALLTVLEDEEVPAGAELWRAVLEESGDLCDTYDLDLVPFAAMRHAGGRAKAGSAAWWRCWPASGRLPAKRAGP